MERESAVGTFSADIFAKVESENGANVIIENQLGSTDHDHLGKVITYASGKNASVVIWVVARARDEHRQAISWLNSHTDDDCSFFLVEIEALRIGNSEVAPRFSVVESPNEWVRAQRKKSGLSETGQLQVDYWEMYRELALHDTAFSKHMKPRKAQPQNWSDVAIGSTKYHLGMLLLVSRNQVGVYLYVNDAPEIWGIVSEAKVELDAKLGKKSEISTGRKDSRILYTLDDCEIKDRRDLS